MIVCLGEGLVDLICEHPVASLTEADAFAPHFGGALANVAVAARRAGAEAGLAGAAGDDEWGRWLRGRLEREGVDLRFFELLEDAQTPIAFASFDERPRADLPDLRRRDRDRGRLGRPAARAGDRGGDRARLQLDHPRDTPDEREVTLRARELALERGASGSASTPTSGRTAGAATRARRPRRRAS